MTNRYYIKQITNNVYLINDDIMCSTYVVIGENKALVIDAGIATNEENLLSKVKEITNLPLCVVITHAHFDHIGHLNEFENFYIAKKELDNIKEENIKNKAIVLNDRDLFDLGGIVIESYITKGHTSASTIFIDKVNKVVFTGDQFGSGCGVWMQVNEATTLSTYSNEIEKFIRYLNTIYESDKWLFLGGHYGQEHTGRLGYNPLNLTMISNLRILCDKLIANEVLLQDSNAKMFNNEKSYYTNYNNAEMIIRKSLIK